MGDFSKSRRAQLAGSILILLCFAGTSSGQDACQAPNILNPKQGQNIFTDKQEVDLGDAIAQQMHQRLRVSDNSKLTAYLQAVGERLEKELPPNQLQFRFYLLDIPYANALSLPGGRIYISPKMIALAQNEDELAGVLAHEMGHIIAHQSAILTSRLLREVLGITQVGDRDDILDKVHKLIASQAKEQKVLRKVSGQEEQEGADAVAVYTAARAGYSPESFQAVFDRLVGTKPQRGNWFTNLFGSNSPDSHRVREMTKAIDKLPAGCFLHTPKTTSDDFKKWRESVIAFSDWDHEELLHSVALRTKLDPPLRTDIHHLKFSPDGRYVLAQDDSLICVLSRQPLKMLFTIEATDALPGEFTPDSQSVAFNNPSLRVEVWDVATARRTSVNEVYVVGGCAQSLLSPDAKSLACRTLKEKLSVLDVATGETLVEKPFPVPMILDFLYFLGVEGLDFFPPELSSAAFSPDSRYFLAGTQEFHAATMMSGAVTVAFDLKERKAISLPGSITKLLPDSFVFLGPDRIMGVNPSDPKKSAVVSFPDGRVLTELFVSDRQTISTVAKGDYIVLRPIQDYDAGLLDLKTQKLVLGSKTSAFDLYDWEYISEARNGELGLFDIKSTQPAAGISLPPGQLANLSTGAVQPDFRWLAISSGSRGVVWNLATGKGAYELRRFNGAYFDGNGALYADFPKFEKTDRSLVRLDLPGPTMKVQFVVDTRHAIQVGPYLIVLHPKDSSNPRFDRDVTLEMHNAETNQSLWSHFYPKGAPRMAIEPDAKTLITYQLASDDGAREEAKSDPELEKILHSKDKDDYFIEVFDAATGKRNGALLIKSSQSSLRISHILAAGNWVVLADTQKEVVLYSLSDGEEKARIFGELPRVSTAAGLLAVRTEQEGLALYDLDSLEQVDEYYFSSPIVMQQFSPDGKRLFVLTADQTAFVLDVSTQSAAPTTAASRK